MFPRLQKRGPIEAPTCWRPAAASRGFPRLQKRGPIEATPISGVELAFYASFHAYKSVAPLKHPNHPSPFHFGCGFHAYKSVAPLKRFSRATGRDEDGEFPRLQKRGPIEALTRLSSSPRLYIGFHAYKSVAPLKHPYH